MAKQEEKVIADERLLSIYKGGFSHIASAVNQVQVLWPQTAELLVDAYAETNARLLEQVRDERIEVEAEIKRFLAQANSKLMYLANLEGYLEGLDKDIKRIYEEASAEGTPQGTASEGGEGLEEATTDTAGRRDQKPSGRTEQDAV